MPMTGLTCEDVEVLLDWANMTDQEKEDMRKHITQMHKKIGCTFFLFAFCVFNYYITFPAVWSFISYNLGD